jgi:outer membrane protein TolC
LPLDAKAKAAMLAAPDPARLRVEALALKHPLLKPLAVDLRDGLSPDEAAVLAVLANPDLKAIRDQRALASAQLLEAGLLPDPTLAYSRDVPTGSDPSLVTAHSVQLGLDLTALLTRGLRHRAAQAEQQAVDLEVAWAEWQVAAAAKLSVVRRRTLEAQLPWAEEIAEIQESVLGATERAAQRGEATLGEVAAARTAADSAHRDLLTLRQARAREAQLLNGLLGLPPHQAVPLAPADGPPSGGPEPSEQVLLEGLDQRLDLLALQKGYESQDARLRLAIWSQFPSIGLSLSRARDTSGIGTRGYGVGVTLPLFNRGQGQVRLEEATRQQLYDQFLARRFQARAEVVQIRSDQAMVRQMRAAAEAARPALADQAKASEAAFRAGQLDLSSRAQARTALLQHLQTLVGLRGSLAELRIALEIAAGRSLAPVEHP